MHRQHTDSTSTQAFAAMRHSFDVQVQRHTLVLNPFRLASGQPFVCGPPKEKRGHWMLSYM